MKGVEILQTRRRLLGGILLVFAWLFIGFCFFVGLWLGFGQPKEPKENTCKHSVVGGPGSGDCCSRILVRMGYGKAMEQTTKNHGKP